MGSGRRELRLPDQIPNGIDTLAAAQVSAILVLASALFYGGHMQIIERSRALGLPTIYWFSHLVRRGDLSSLGPSEDDIYRVGARQVVRILNGAAPAEMPIEQPTKFELVINLETATCASCGGRETEIRVTAPGKSGV